MSLVTEAIPDILTDRQMRLLTLGLRAKVRDTDALKSNVLFHFQQILTLKRNMCFMLKLFCIADICLWNQLFLLSLC